MATPFKRDILKELAAACQRGRDARSASTTRSWTGTIPTTCPRRDWEEKDRPAAGANFDRYIEYMKAQLKELITGYGPLGVLWFDGEWETTWTDRPRPGPLRLRPLAPAEHHHQQPRRHGAGGA